MRIEGPFQPDISKIAEGTETPNQKGIVSPFNRDSLEVYIKPPFPEAEQTEQAQAADNQPAAAANEDDDDFRFTDLLPFGIGYWLDDEGTFATDLGKTILSIIIPIPFVSGLIAGELGPYLGNAIVDVAEWGAGAVSDSAEWGVGAIKDAGEWIGGAGEDVVDFVGNAASDVAGGIGDAVESVGDFFGGLFD